ncbi:MAG TPA: ATP-binding protein [Methylomirabilota bacterium]|nr:ATP-binding protein [Methylomirabilota bacterium]
MPSAVVPADHAGILHALLDASPLAVIGLAADGTVRLWSPAAERLFGWKEEHVLGRQDPLAPGPLAGEARRLLDRALAGEPVSGVEVVRQTLDGALVTVNVWAMLVGLPAPTTVRVLFLYQDVTERKRTEQQLVRQREALHRNEKLADLGRLAAGVAHELRNPLAVIDTRVQLLERLLARGGEGTESLAHHVGYLEEAAARMKRIVEGLSSYARPSRVEPAVLDVREVLVATRELLRAEARGQGTEIVLEVPERRVPVLGDRSRLMQILINLGTNALEAMSEHPGRLVLRACLESADDADRVVVEVSDTGPGIPPDRLESIWEPFFTTKAEGTGLGLSIVRSLIAEQPGAVLTMQSALDRGTTFRLSLLAAPPPASREERLA